jgi:hypothetical protein
MPAEVVCGHDWPGTMPSLPEATRTFQDLPGLTGANFGMFGRNFGFQIFDFGFAKALRVEDRRSMRRTAGL